MSKINPILINIKNKLDFYGEKISEKKLIKFDFKTILLIVLVIICFSGAVLFKINGSSIGYWNQVVSDGNDSRKGLLLGNPRPIRSDEWLVQTPFILSELSQKDKFSIENKSLGEGRVPLLMNLPTNHLSSFFRPQNWGFFILDSERGFSFYWNYKIFGLFLSFFLLLMLVTRNNFWISLFGSIWLLFSSFIQWWFSTSMPETIIAFSMIFVASTYILLSKNQRRILIGAFLLSIFSVNFVLAFYPPFQVPIAYLLIFLLMGFLLQNSSFKEFKVNLKVRLLGLFLPASVFVSVLYVFYLDTKETIVLTMNTVYPGKRVSRGGQITLVQFFSGFYAVFMRQGHFPAFMGNICEASSFILLFPLAFISAIHQFLKKKKDILLIVVIAYLVLMSAWMLIGYPTLIAKASLMSFVTAKRTFVGVGIGSIIALAIAMREKKEIIKRKKTLIISLAIIFILIVVNGFIFRDISPDFVRYRYIFFTGTFLTLLSYLFLRGKNVAFFFFAALLAFAATFYVNPISIGLSPIKDKALSKVAMEQNQKSPNQLWVVYGNYTFANFLKASGINVFNGVQYTPKMNQLNILDPSKKNEDVYNRYAHMVFLEQKNQNNGVVFQLVQSDMFTIEVNPCSEELKSIGINRFLFSYQPQEEKIFCLEPIGNPPVSGAWLYKRR